MPDDNEEQERRQKNQRALNEHDRLMERSAAHTSRDVLHDASANHEVGAYTVQEARDRAAHVPSILDREQPENRAEEAQMLDALHKELFPAEKAREAYDRMTGPEHPPADVEGRQQWQDMKQMAEPAASQQEKQAFEKPITKARTPDMTPEQQASIDKALTRADINDKLGGASDVSGKPQPNDTTPMDKARDVGQDLHKQGVTMDKE